MQCSYLLYLLHILPLFALFLFYYYSPLSSVNASQKSCLGTVVNLSTPNSKCFAKSLQLTIARKLDCMILPDSQIRWSMNGSFLL